MLLDRWLVGIAGYGGDPDALSRTQRGSRNRTTAIRSLAREHNRIANIRRNFLHEVSSQLAKTHSALVVEDLPVANLIRNKRLAQAITDAAWTEFARQLEYKTTWLGGELVVCDRWFPSTKILLRLWMGRAGDGVGDADLSLRSLRPGHGQGPQRRRQSRRLGRGRQLS